MDAYQILGVSRNSNEKEIKEAYRKLAIEYSGMPDKMNEINNAFDTAMSMLRVGASHSTHNSDDTYSRIREYIDNGNADAAISELKRINAQSNGEWNFLMGIAYQYKGWTNEAFQYLNRATALAPNNAEYRKALDEVQNSINGNLNGNPYGNNFGPTYANGCCCPDNFCDCCTAMICFDMCCDGGGGCC